MTIKLELIGWYGFHATRKPGEHSFSFGIGRVTVKWGDAA